MYKSNSLQWECFIFSIYLDSINCSYWFKSNNLSSQWDSTCFCAHSNFHRYYKCWKLTSKKVSGSASHRVQCWRRGWWEWEAGIPLYCPGRSSLPGTQKPGKKDRKKEWEGERGEVEDRGGGGGETDMEIKQCIDHTIYWIQRKKTYHLSLSSHSFWGKKNPTEK